MDLNVRLQKSVVYGVYFLVSAIAMPLLLQFIGTINPETVTAATLNFFLWSIILSVFFLTYALTLQGYYYLGKKFDISPLVHTASLAGWVFGIFCFVIIFSVYLDLFQSDTAASALGNTLNWFIAVPYALLPFVISVIAYRLGTHLPTAKYPLWVCTIWWILFLVLGLLSLATESDLQRIIGIWVWWPLPEALFVIASILLFKAAADA